MHIRQWILLAAATFTSSCGSNPLVSSESQTLTAAQFKSVSKSARIFALEVASDVTKEGPSAWLKHFEESPSFFMASEGRLVSPDNASAAMAIQELSRSTPHIELTWGSDLRVDPLTPGLAVLAASYREVEVSSTGEHKEISGFFTGVTEQQQGRWRFRDAHWSVGHE
ncbi:MAG TPA: hypothetical protein VK789_06315 [Bryobacteraceae bacterium]|nr:hypothetical protein [Bryobacteraceae bacterium]